MFPQSIDTVERLSQLHPVSGERLRKSYNRSVAAIAIRPTPAPARTPSKQSLIFQEVIPEVWEMTVEVMAHHAVTAHATVTTSHSGRAYAHYCNSS